MNIAHRIREASNTFPEKKSVVFSRRKGRGYEYPSYTFREFEARASQMAHFFVSQGITRGTRTLLFVTPRLDFSIITFALFKVGAVPVLIDPGMGVKNLLASIAQVRPEALVSIGKVHWIRRLKPGPFSSVKIKVSLDPVGGRTSHLYTGMRGRPSEFAPVEVSPSDTAAILFTSGGTGIPKGVIYTHGILHTQTDLLRSMFNLSEKNSDLPGFPLFALFTLAMGMTSVIPDMDPTRPAECDPARIVRNILDNQVSFVAGSPAIWERVGRYCVERRIQLASVRQVVMFGAPVRHEIHELFKKVLPFGDTFTPYGATESLPVSLISGSEVLRTTQALSLVGAGTCIGRAVPATKISIIKASDIPEGSLVELATGERGEIVVQGAQVTPAYFEMDQETARAKILHAGELWHRMGDLGYLDSESRLWFLGRKAHRVITDEEIFYPISVEAIFNQHPEVRRSALIALRKNSTQHPALVIERWDGHTQVTGRFLQELRDLGARHAHTEKVTEFFLHPSFPVDVRHNIKIDRLGLAAWAQEKWESGWSSQKST